MKFNRKTLGSALLVTLALPLSWVFGSETRAGYRPLEVSLSNMTPDGASTDASKKCVQTLRDRVVADDAHLKNWMETPLREAIGAKKGTDAGEAPFTSWSVEALAPAMAEQDTFLAVDCRPEEKSLTVLMVNPAKAKVVFRLRGEDFSRARLIWFGDEVMRHAWQGFVP